MSADNLAHALGAKEIGKRKWQARCPYHDDSEPSLSIGEGDKGKVLVTCHAGCDNVFQRLVDDGVLGRSVCEQPEVEPEQRYQYMDATGTLAFEVVRLAGKKFLTRQPTSDG